MLRSAAVTMALLLPAVGASAQSRPSFSAQPGGIVTITLPPSLLADREIDRRIRSGLTTTFLLIAQQREQSRRGAARLEVRFDLWDEVWLVRRVEFDGKEERRRLSTRDALEKWWRSPSRLLGGAAGRVALNVTLTVLPFSAAEGEDARDWISKSAGVTEPGSASPLVTALIGTTISAKPIRTYRWSAEVALR